MFNLATGHFEETPFPLGSMHIRLPGPLVVGQKKAPDRACGNYRQRRTRTARLDRFETAIRFSYGADMPLNYGITTTWSALITAGEKNEGH